MNVLRPSAVMDFKTALKPRKERKRIDNSKSAQRIRISVSKNRVDNWEPLQKYGESNEDDFAQRDNFDTVSDFDSAPQSTDLDNNSTDSLADSVTSSPDDKPNFLLNKGTRPFRTSPSVVTKISDRLRIGPQELPVSHHCFSDTYQENSASFDNSVTEMRRQNIRALSLIICTFTYLMIGAAIFDALESEQDKERRDLVEMVTDKLKRKYNFTQRDYKVLEHVVIKSIPHKAGYQWQFAGAFYFATVVITTVGYGHSTPATQAGRMFCIIYALIGIPINLVMFQSIGERLNALISYCIKKFKHLMGIRAGDGVPKLHTILVSATLGSLVILLGTYLFSTYENWSLFESFYYCFVTLTTIGFGDYVALQKAGALRDQAEYVVLSLLFMLFGMAIFAAAVNLFVLRFMATSSDTDSSGLDRAKSVVIKPLRKSSEDRTRGSVTSLGMQKLRTSTISGTSSSLVRALTKKRKTQQKPLVPLTARHPQPIAGILPVHPPVHQSSPVKPQSCACGRGVRPGSQFISSGKNKHYTIRRAPTRQIQHLLIPPHSNTRNNTPRESDSFLVYEMRRQRRSSQ